MTPFCGVIGALPLLVCTVTLVSQIVTSVSLCLCGCTDTKTVVDSSGNQTTTSSLATRTFGNAPQLTGDGRLRVPMVSDKRVTSCDKCVSLRVARSLDTRVTNHDIAVTISFRCAV